MGSKVGWKERDRIDRSSEEMRQIHSRGQQHTLPRQYRGVEELQTDEMHSIIGCGSCTELIVRAVIHVFLLLSLELGHDGFA